jgi:protein-disulfide isomerase
MKKEDYKDFVFLKISKEEFEELLNKAKEQGKHTKVASIDDLTRWEITYRLSIEEKQSSAKEAHRRKKALKDIQIFRALENYYNGLFKNDAEDINANKLSKLANVNYRTAKRFWDEYNLDYWIKEFEIKGSKALNSFKVNELAESLVYAK